MNRDDVNRATVNQQSPTLVLAHRGSGPHGPEPENTVAAFRAAARLGADGVELDVRRTRDRCLAIHHDAELPDGRIIAECDAHELPSQIPSLAEALDACEDLQVNVEVKNFEGDVDFDPSEWVSIASARLLAERGFGERPSAAAAAAAGGGQGDVSGSGAGGVVVSSFSRECLAAVRATAPALETAWLVGAVPTSTDIVAVARDDGHQGLHPYHALVDAALVRRAHAAGLAVRVWTVNAADQIAELGRLGVEAIVTNEVALARAALGRPQLANEGSAGEQSLP